MLRLNRVLFVVLLAASSPLLAQHSAPSAPLTAAQREELRKKAEALRERNAREREEIQKGFRPSNSPEPQRTATASGATPAQICRATIAALMGRDPQIITVNREVGGVTFVSYRRPDDGTYWANKCKVEGSNVIWGTENGRWRDHPLDGTVSYDVSQYNLIIRQRFSDGSS